MNDTESAAPAPVVVISGTSSGIGLATARATARASWTTVATMRDPGRAHRLRDAAHQAGVSLDFRRLDVTDPGSIADCLGGAVADHGRLDAVVNNAGSAYVGTIENDDLDDVRGPYAPALDRYIARTTAQFSAAAQMASDVGDVVLRVLTAEQPPLRVQTTDAARAFAGTKLADLDGSAVLAVTRTWVGLS